MVGCVYCGRVTETRDHVPSRVLLDEPYPDNLPVVPSREACNTNRKSSTKLDEEEMKIQVWSEEKTAKRDTRESMRGMRLQ
jgi:hypothetical protein